MACGVHLGILLICLVQAEHVRCLWASQALRQDGNTNVGFLQQTSGFGGRYPQNQLRQASGSPGSAQSSSLNTDSVGSGSSQRFPTSGYTQTPSQPARSGYASVGLVQSGAESKPNWQATKLKQENMQKMPKKEFRLSSSIAGGSSLSKYDQTQSSKKRTWPVQQGTTSNHRSSGSESLQRPREIYSQPAMKSSSLSSEGPAASRRIPVRTKTSSSAVARRVSSSRSSAASKPSSFSSLQNERTSNNPSQSEARKPYSSKLVPVNAHNLPASGTSSAGPSGQGFAPSRTHEIPQRFGGYAIRRLKKPADQKEVSDRKPAPQTYVAPQRPSLQQPTYVAPQRPSLQQASYVAPQRPSLQQASYVAPQRPSLQQASYVAPQRPSLQQASYVAPQRPSLHQPTYVAPQRPSAYNQPQVQSPHPTAKWMRVRPLQWQVQ